MSSTNHFKLIGDPHVTRKFELGVPLARRGEREKLLMDELYTQLNTGDERLVIMVGDLFEKPICSLQDLYEVINMVLKASRSQPHRKFVMMAGNHDISPQKHVKGAFDLLLLFKGLVKNLFIAERPMIIEDVAVFPWEWDRTAREQIEDVRGRKFKYAVGHWDLVAYDENHMDHICPAPELIEMGAEEIHSGHWHVAGIYKVHGVPVNCTGSMQPMTHAEDPDKKMYVTLTLEEYEETDPDSLKNKYVRVLAPSADEVTVLPDCLGFKVQLVSRVESIDDHEPQVSMEGFKVSDVVTKQLTKHEVPDSVASEIKEKLNVTD